MLKQTGLSNTPRLYSTSGTFGEIDIVASDRGVTLSVTGRNYDTLGRLHLGNALANLSVSDAQRLSGLLSEAIAVSQDADPRQPGLWSEATLRNTGRRVAKAARTVALLACIVSTSANAAPPSEWVRPVPAAQATQEQPDMGAAIYQLLAQQQTQLAVMQQEIMTLHADIVTTQRKGAGQ
jgi:hypothetical protein